MGLKSGNPDLYGGVTNIFLREMRQGFDAFKQRQACWRKLLHFLLESGTGIKYAGAELSVPSCQFAPVFISLALKFLRKKRDDHAPGQRALWRLVVFPFDARNIRDLPDIRSVLDAGL